MTIERVLEAIRHLIADQAAQARSSQPDLFRRHDFPFAPFGVSPVSVARMRRGTIRKSCNGSDFAAPGPAAGLMPEFEPSHFLQPGQTIFAIEQVENRPHHLQSIGSKMLQRPAKWPVQVAWPASVADVGHAQSAGGRAR
jgi:hypothetical protein